jgi:twitching motility two-component system response regulator PilH
MCKNIHLIKIIIEIRNFIFLIKEGSAMKTIFFADDSATQRTMIAEFLYRNGFSVKVFKDGQSILDELNYDQPEVIILDIVMPNMNGFQVCRELKKDSRTKNIPIIISSIKGTEADIYWAKKIGAEGYVIKQPSYFQDLLSAIKKLSTFQKAPDSLENCITLVK